MIAMRHIDKATERKLYWLFIPMAIVAVMAMIYLWFDIDLIQKWFGINTGILSWLNPTLMGCVILLAIGYSIAAIKQKCWGELAIILMIVLVSILNMCNVFVKLFN